MNSEGVHRTVVCTAGAEQQVLIPAKPEGLGSSVNGGELLFLALATCYCNDIYREAKEMGVQVTAVSVHVTGDFGGKGQPASNIRYRATVTSTAPIKDVERLMRHTDAVAEIHNTLRQGMPVVLEECVVLRGE